jgi:hypothetical protein
MRSDDSTGGHVEDALRYISGYAAHWDDLKYNASEYALIEMLEKLKVVGRALSGPSGAKSARGEALEEEEKYRRFMESKI